MRVAAFDAKEFRRGVDPRMFFSALGGGVEVKDAGSFRENYLANSCQIKKDMGIESRRLFFCSSDVKRKLSGVDDRVFDFCSRLVQGSANDVTKIFISYAIFSPAKTTEVFVGGSDCPREAIATVKFMRDHLPQMFPHIAAWSHSSRNPEAMEYHLDGFQSNHTLAWKELVQDRNPLVFPHGDECNPYISFADIVAYLTDVGLSRKRLRLEPADIVELWSRLGFECEVRFVDNRVQSKIAWYSQKRIDISAQLPRKMVFIIADQEPDVVKASDVYESAVRKAQDIEGSVQFFDKSMNRGWIKDGHVLVYIGRESEQYAKFQSDMCDVEVLSGKELRKQVPGF
jgi:hypothetical protein